MSLTSRRASASFIPAYKENAVLQLIAASGIGYIMFHLARVCMIVFGAGGLHGEIALQVLVPNIGLGQLNSYGAHWWTILTYGWADHSFWQWLTNMVWLYCFGSVLQNLAGFRQVIPVFFAGLLGGGIIMLLMQLLPYPQLKPVLPVMSAQAGVMALAAAAVTLSPRYKVFIGADFGIRILVVAIIYAVLNLVVHSGVGHMPMLTLSLGGILSGMGMIMLLKRGNNIGAWIYSKVERVGSSATPDEQAHAARRAVRRNKVSGIHSNSVTQERIDEILEKIHRKGFQSLSKEEKELLQRASKS